MGNSLGFVREPFLPWSFRAPALSSFLRWSGLEMERDLVSLHAHSCPRPLRVCALVFYKAAKLIQCCNPDGHVVCPPFSAALWHDFTVSGHTHTLIAALLSSVPHSSPAFSRQSLARASDGVTEQRDNCRNCWGNQTAQPRWFPSPFPSSHLTVFLFSSGSRSCSASVIF